ADNLRPTGCAWKLASAQNVAANWALRLTASNYSRSPTALECPPHAAPVAVVPMRASTLRERTSATPSNVVAVNGVDATVTALARSAFRVMPWTHRVWPAATRVPFLYASTRRSKFVPMSSLFFRPSHTCAAPRALSVPLPSPRGLVQVPTASQGLPLANARAGES